MTAYWYATRGTGVVALLLLTAAFVLGALGPLGFRTERWPRFLVAGLHRNVTLLAVAFVAVHVVTTVVDGFAPIRWLDVVVPFVSRYRPLWLGFGTVALDLASALVVTSLLRARIGLRVWRAVHWLAYASWPVALLHSLGTGSDARSGWMAALAGACAAAVGLAVLRRVAAARVRLAGRLVAASAVAGLLVAGAAWFRTGPLQAGWARRAGTPQALLGVTRAAASAPVARTAAALPSLPFSAPLVGRYAQAGPDSNGLVSVEVTALARSAGAQLKLDLWGEPLEGGGVALRASRVSFGPAADPEAYAGRIIGLDGSRVLVGLRDAAGTPVDLALELRLDPGAGTVSGALRAYAAADRSPASEAHDSGGQPAVSGEGDE